MTKPGAIISIFLKALYYLTCMDILAACVSVHHVYAVSGSQKTLHTHGVKSLRMGVTNEIMGSPRAEVAGVVRYHVGAGN